MKTQKILIILFGITLIYLILDVNLGQKPKKKINSMSDNVIALSVDTFPKYLVEKDDIVTPKGMKYHILVVPADTAQNWTITKMSIPKNQKFHLLIPEIE